MEVAVHREKSTNIHRVERKTKKKTNEQQLELGNWIRGKQENLHNLRIRKSMYSVALCSNTQYLQNYKTINVGDEDAIENIFKFNR